MVVFIRKYIIFPLLTIIMLSGCKKEDNIPQSLAGEINEFIWKGMNNYYLWQDSVPALSDDRFETLQELQEYAGTYDHPEDFFETLIWKRNVVDKWSWIVDDYEELEAYFQGVRKTTGAKIKLYRRAEGSDQLFGVVRYIIPGTPAEAENVSRGDVFASVNGTALNVSNYRELLIDSESYTLDMGTYSYDTENQSVIITPTGEHISLTKGEYDENPIQVYTTFNTQAGKVGYLLYNAFVSNYDHQLNDAFAYFQNEGITDLILDLRYNGGGSVATAIYLSGMITGQFEGQIFTREVWNSKISQWLEQNHPDWAVNLFTNEMNDGTFLNNLYLTRLFIITTSDSASASELVINALNPYIDIITIGGTTHGKYAASITLYDSPDFTKDDLNPDHKWAIQPIVLKEINVNGEYAPGGFPPDYELYENPGNMGILGDPGEPLLGATLDIIENGYYKNTSTTLPPASFHYDNNPMEMNMYIENPALSKK